MDDEEVVAGGRLRHPNSAVGGWSRRWSAVLRIVGFVYWSAMVMYYSDQTTLDSLVEGIWTWSDRNSSLVLRCGLIVLTIFVEELAVRPYAGSRLR